MGTPSRYGITTPEGLVEMSIHQASTTQVDDVFFKAVEEVKAAKKVAKVTKKAITKKPVAAKKVVAKKVAAKKVVAKKVVAKKAAVKKAVAPKKVAKKSK